MGLLEEVGDGIKALVTFVVGVVATIVGMFGDPTFLLSNSGLVLSATTWTTKYLGPEFAPGVPWDQLLVGVALAGLALSLFKLYSRRTNDRST